MRFSFSILHSTFNAVFIPSPLVRETEEKNSPCPLRFPWLDSVAGVGTPTPVHKVLLTVHRGRSTDPGHSLPPCGGGTRWGAQVMTLTCHPHPTLPHQGGGKKDGCSPSLWALNATRLATTPSSLIPRGSFFLLRAALANRAYRTYWPAGFRLPARAEGESSARGTVPKAGSSGLAAPL